MLRTLSTLLLRTLTFRDYSLKSFTQQIIPYSSYELLPTSSASANQNRPKPIQKRRIHYKSAIIAMIIILAVLLVGVSIAGLTRYPISYPPLLDATIDELSWGLSQKTFTSVDLVKAYIARIVEVNTTFHAITELNPEAISIAQKLDNERYTGSIRSSLHGMPILLKNNIGTKDELNTTAGSWALAGAKLSSDATVVQKLRDAGVIILGKTSVSEWANFRSLNASNGWSGVAGQVYGAYSPSQDPQGSSSGSAVAAALGLALGSLGTETDGSITSPAGFNNVVGIKPTVGLTSRYMVIPVSEHEDTVGTLTRTVKDGAHILQAISGVDRRDNYTSAIPNSAFDYVAACNLSALSGARIGIPWNLIALDASSTPEPVTEAFEQALEIMRTEGAHIINTSFPAAQEFSNSSLPLRVSSADFVVNLQTYLDSLSYNPNNITSLAVLRQFTQSFPLEDYPTPDTSIWDETLQGWNNTDPRFWPTYQKVLYYGTEGGLLGAITRDNLDAVVLPRNIGSSFASVVGAPIVMVPMGFYSANVSIVKNSWGLIDVGPNVPIGLSFLGAKFTEETLIGLAYAFEQKTKVRGQMKPYLVPRTELSDVVGA